MASEGTRSYIAYPSLSLRGKFRSPQFDRLKVVVALVSKWFLDPKVYVPLMLYSGLVYYNYLKTCLLLMGVVVSTQEHRQQLKVIYATLQRLGAAFSGQTSEGEHTNSAATETSDDL